MVQASDLSQQYQTHYQQYTVTHYQQYTVFVYLEITPLQVSPLLPSRTINSPCGTPSRMPPTDSKKAIRCISTNNSQRLRPNDLQSHRHDPLFHQGELQHSGGQPGACEYSHTGLVPLTQGEKERVQPLTRSLVPEPVLRRGEPNYI